MLAAPDNAGFAEWEMMRYVLRGVFCQWSHYRGIALRGVM
jgi:hypothetical protein